MLRRLTPARLAELVDAETLARKARDAGGRVRLDLTDEDFWLATKHTRKLRGRYYGRQAFVMLDESDLDPSEVGGHVGGQCCSHAWADAVWQGDTIYPPPANRTPMKHCPKCGADVPFNTFEGNCCSDCRSVFHHQQFGTSVSGRAFTIINELKLRQDPAEEAAAGLLPEDAASLRREISRAKVRGQDRGQGPGDRGQGKQAEEKTLQGDDRYNLTPPTVQRLSAVA